MAPSLVPLTGNLVPEFPDHKVAQGTQLARQGRGRGDHHVQSEGNSFLKESLRDYTLCNIYKRAHTSLLRWPLGGPGNLVPSFPG